MGNVVELFPSRRAWKPPPVEEGEVSIYLYEIIDWDAFGTLSTVYKLEVYRYRNGEWMPRGEYLAKTAADVTFFVDSVAKVAHAGGRICYFDNETCEPDETFYLHETH